MRVKTIHAQVERKKPMEQYGSVAVSYGAWADLEEGEDEAEANRRLLEMVNTVARAELAVWEEKRMAAVREVFMGLPVEVRQAAIVAATPTNGAGNGKEGKE